ELRARGLARLERGGERAAEARGEDARPGPYRLGQEDHVEGYLLSVGVHRPDDRVQLVVARRVQHLLRERDGDRELARLVVVARHAERVDARAQVSEREEAAPPGERRRPAPDTPTREPPGAQPRAPPVRESAAREPR